MNTLDRSVGRLLVACVTGAAWRVPSSAVARLAQHADPAQLALAAEYHGVPGYVRAALLTVGAREELVETLLPAYHRSLRCHLRALSDLGVVDAALAAAAVPYVVVKGPVLAALEHERADLRAYSDLDVLVPPPHFSRAVEALLAVGCRPIAHAFRALIEVQAGELTMVMPSGGTLDLHWHTLNSPAVRATFRIDPSALVSRARRVDVGGVSAPVLDPADTLVYVAMHTVLSGAHRLVWTKDMDRLIIGAPPWHEVGRRAREARAQLLVALAIRHTATVLGTQVPAAARTEIPSRSPWPWLAQESARVSRPEYSVSDKRLPSRVAARSTRYGMASSLRELTHRAKAAGAPPSVTPHQREPDADPDQALAEFTASVGVIACRPMR